MYVYLWYFLPQGLMPESMSENVAPDIQKVPRPAKNSVINKIAKNNF